MATDLLMKRAEEYRAAHVAVMEVRQRAVRGRLEGEARQRDYDKAKRVRALAEKALQAAALLTCESIACKIEVL